MMLELWIDAFFGWLDPRVIASAAAYHEEINKGA